MADAVFLTLIVAASVAVLANAPSWLRQAGIYRRRSEFNCTCCGNCCRFRVIPVTEDDIRRLEAAGYRDFVSYDGEPSLKRVNGRCLFLRDDRCTVHQHRPTVCREFPFFKIMGVGYAARASFCPALEELE